MTIVREWSPAGPCLTLGKLVKETARFYFYDEWRGGDKFEGRKRIMKPIESGHYRGHYSRAHVEPCPSCRDHPKTQYPNGYMD